MIVRQNGLLYVSFRPNEVGFWNLELSNEGLGSGDFSVNIDATCTFSFLSDFRFLDLSLIHPHLRILPGYPTIGSLPGKDQMQTGINSNPISVIVLVMVAASPTQISALEGVSLVDEAGNVLVTYEKDGTDFQDAFLIQTASGQNITVPLPSTPFYLRLHGLDSSGNVFWRMLTDLITPASTQVHVTACISPEASPGIEVECEFTIVNMGVAAQIIVEVSDELGFLESYVPRAAYLETEESFTVVANFRVPSDAEVNSQSLVTVTAESQLDLTTNYATTSITVSADQTDLSPPECHLTRIPQCLEATEESCASFPWKATG